MAATQHDDHCIMNVNEEPWRIQWICDGDMGLVHEDHTAIADLSKIDWVKYCDNARAYLDREIRQRVQREEDERQKKEWLAQGEEAERRYREQEEARRVREVCDFYNWRMAHERLLASGYGSVDDLEDEAVLVDLEFTDVKSILMVDHQTTHLERLVA
jgi:hypothetical protein